MALSTLATQVNAMIDRIVVLEPLSIAQVTTGTFATKEWMYLAQTFPYWTNRPTRLVRRQHKNEWELGLNMRLTLAHISSATVGTNTPQELAWKYIPEVLTYFAAQRVRTMLAPTGYAEIDYIDRTGCTITCPNGLDYFNNPYLGSLTVLYIDFNLVVPFSLMGVEE